MERDTVLRSRFSQIVWAEPAKSTTVTVVGVGGIGSWLSLFLSRAGYNVQMIDNDKVERHNIGGQLFSKKNEHDFKTHAMLGIINEFSPGTTTTAVCSKFKYSNVEGSSVIVSAVDNMATRKEILEGWKKHLSSAGAFCPVKLFVDGRMMAEQFQVFFVTPGRIAEYEKTLFNDAEVPDEPCTNKATTHFGAGIAYTITKGINNFLAIEAGEPRELPFKVEEEGFLFTNRQTQFTL